MKQDGEVERALEELKNYFRNNGSNHSEILNLAQNLVNALESEKLGEEKKDLRNKYSKIGYRVITHYHSKKFEQMQKDIEELKRK